MRISKTKLLELASQMRCAALSEHLNANGYTTNRGKVWTPAAIASQVRRYRTSRKRGPYQPRIKAENSSGVDALLDAVIAYQDAKKRLLDVVRGGEF